MRKAKLEIHKLTPGMKLAENITNDKGVTMMPSGVRLTPLFISRLDKWKIDSVFVHIEEQEPAAKEDIPADKSPAAVMSIPDRPNASAEQQEFLKSVIFDVGTWFSNVKDNPLMLQLRSIAVKKLVADGPKGKLKAFRVPSDIGGGDGA